MQVTIVETTFQKVALSTVLDALPRAGDFVEMSAGIFVVEKIVFRPERPSKEQILVFVTYK